MQFDAFLERCRAPMARVRRLAPPRPLDPSRRSLARAHPRRNPRDGHREQAPPPQLRRRLARPRRSLRRSGMLQRGEPGRRRHLESRRPASSHATISRSSTAPPTHSAAPSTRTPRPARSPSTTWTSAHFLAAAPWAPARIGAYFYDGGHSFADQYDGVALAIPHLADDAVVIIDDTNKRAARSANNLVARALPGFKLVLDLRTPRNHSPTWWNGVQVFRYQRRPTDASIKFPTPGFAHPQTYLRRHLPGDETPPPSPKKRRTKPNPPTRLRQVASRLTRNSLSTLGAGVTPAEEV